MTHAARIVVMCLLGAGLLLMYVDPLTALVRQWDASPMYSYAFAVPPIALFLLWTKRDELRRQPVQPARWWGGSILALALMMLVVGGAASLQILQQFSFLVAIVGLGLILFGAAHLRLGAPALGYLLFMIPFWDVFTEPLHWPFQNNSATLGVAMLHAAGIPALQEGTVISLSNITLEVARQCSGVNYLIAVLALALPLCYVRLQGWSRRVLLIGSALVVAALANGVRVALIGALAYWDIGSPLHGPFHVLHGLFVAGIGYVVLFAGLHVLEKGQKPAQAEATPRNQLPGSSSWSVRMAGGLAIAFWTLAFVGTVPASVPTALAMPLDRLPRQLGAWSMNWTEIVNGELATGWNDADSQIHRNYEHRDGRVATVQIWYFESQAQDRELINSQAAHLHRTAIAPRTIPVANGPALTANVVRLPEEVGLFWYELDGVPESSQYGAKMKSLWRTLVSRRSNGAAVMLRARVSKGAGDIAVDALASLAAEVHGALARHWNHAPSTTSRADLRPESQ